jgi:4-hydroxybenzoyl-CoA thioesterase
MTDPIRATVAHRVLMIDVDLVQVNFSRFFDWMDRGYNELLHCLGRPLSQIVTSGYATPVVDAQCNYRRPVTLDDEITTTSWVSEVGRTSYVVTHRFDDARGTFAVGRCTHVWVSLGERQQAEAVPDWLASARIDAPSVA